VRVHLAAEHALELEVAHVGLEALRVALDVARRGFIVLRLGEQQQLGSFGDPLGGAIDLPDVARQARALAPELLGAPGRAPDSRLFQFAAYFLEAFFLAVVLKETPSRTRPVPRDL
jgi:hypothetical protein